MELWILSKQKRNAGGEKLEEETKQIKSSPEPTPIEESSDQSMELP